MNLAVAFSAVALETGRILSVKIGSSTIQYAVRDGFVDLYSLRTATKATRQGSARAAMAEFLHATDAAGIPVTLCASPLTRATNLSRLVQFYASLGFRPTGRSCNMAGDPIMRREVGGA